MIKNYHAWGAQQFLIRPTREYCGPVTLWAVWTMEAKPGDQTEKGVRAPEVKPLETSDAQHLASPSARDKQIAEADRTNQSSGSLTELALKNKGLTREQISAQMEAQGDSISIDYGNGQEASRKSGLTEKDFIQKSRMTAPKIAYDLHDAQRDISRGIKQVGTFLECSKESLTSLEAGNPLYPHQGKEDDYISYSACRQANAEFPELAKRIGEGKGHIDKSLIAATIRLEVAFFKQGVDTGQDKFVLEHGRDSIGRTVSIGPAQMQIRHIERLVSEFPKQLGKFAADPLRAALKKENAPHFVGGYFSEVIQHLNKGTKPDYIGGLDWAGVKKNWSEGDLNAALIYAYNPKKDHIDSVKKQMKIIHEKGL